MIPLHNLEKRSIHLTGTSSEFGVLEANALSIAKSDGILITLLMGYLFCTLSSATPGTFFRVAGIALALVILGAAAMALFAWVLSKIMKGSFCMTYSIMLNAILDSRSTSR